MILKKLGELATKIKGAVLGGNKSPEEWSSTPRLGGHQSHQHHPRFRAHAPGDGHFHLGIHRNRHKSRHKAH